MTTRTYVLKLEEAQMLLVQAIQQAFDEAQIHVFDIVAGVPRVIGIQTARLLMPADIKQVSAFIDAFLLIKANCATFEAVNLGIVLVNYADNAFLLQTESVLSFTEWVKSVLN